MSEETSQIESPEADAAQARRVAELEAQLIELLRRKYKLYWRRKDSDAVVSAGGEAEQAELHTLQSEIKAVFDQIRLIDKKYVVPSFRVFN